MKKIKSLISSKFCYGIVPQQIYRRTHTRKVPTEAFFLLWPGFLLGMNPCNLLSSAPNQVGRTNSSARRRRFLISLQECRLLLACTEVLDFPPKMVHFYETPRLTNRKKCYFFKKSLCDIFIIEVSLFTFYPVLVSQSFRLFRPFPLSQGQHAKRKEKAKREGNRGRSSVDQKRKGRRNSSPLLNLIPPPSLPT